jgi:hypothetical protein
MMAFCKPEGDGCLMRPLWEKVALSFPKAIDRKQNG